jgi:putative ABC transport system permease protein
VSKGTVDPGGIPPGLPLALRLARRELRGGLKGFRVFLACLTLGVAAIAGVGTVSEAMLAGLNAEGRSLLGGDLELRLSQRGTTAEELAWLEARAEVSPATHMRAMARGQAAESQRSLIELRAVDGLYPLYGAVELAPAMPLAEALSQVDGVWGAAAERRLLRRLDLAVGDRVRVGEATFDIRAVLVREPDRTAQAFILGPSFMIARTSLESTGLMQPGSLIHTHYRLRLSAETSVADLTEEIKAAFPEAGWQIRGALEAAPGVRRFIERLGLFLSLVGLTSLLVGGVAVGNAVRSYLEGKTGTIATLKCLGAPGRLVFQVYLVQVMALALVAVAAGLAIGAAAPYLVGAILGDRLGWRAVGAIYPLPLLVAAVFGLLTTLAFSLWPLAHARGVPAASLFRDLVAPLRVPVGRATWAAIALSGLLLAGLAIATATDRRLALYFVAGTVGALVLFRATGLGIMALARRARRPRDPGLRLAIANLHRPGAPTGSVVMSLGLGLTVLVAIALIEGNLGRQIERNLPEQAPGFYFIDIQPDQVTAFEETVNSVPGVTELRRVPMLRGRITAVNGRPSEDLEIPPEIEWVFRGDRGLTWSRDPLEGVELTAGAWWPTDYAGPPLVSLDAEVGELLGLGPGDSLTINILGRSVEVEIANLRLIDWSNLTINFVMVFSPGLLESAPQSQIATVKASSPDAEDAVERAVTERFANVSAIRVKEALEAVGALIADIAIALRATAAVALVSGVLVLAGAIAAGHHRRVYDAVVLKVLGATRRDLGRAFLFEYGLLGLATAAIAGLLGSLAAWLVLTEVMHMDFTFLPGAVIWTALIATAITLLLGFAGTWRALSQKAAPLLRNE